MMHYFTTFLPFIKKLKRILFNIYIMDKEAAVQHVIKNNIEGVFIECGVGDGQSQHA